jgi:hypothetical protein
MFFELSYLAYSVQGLWLPGAFAGSEVAWSAVGSGPNFSWMSNGLWIARETQIKGLACQDLGGKKDEREPVNRRTRSFEHVKAAVHC